MKITLKNNKMKEDETINSIDDILTRREVKITKLIIDGYSNKEIATRLNISFHTVRNHRHNILLKTQQKNITGLIKFALNNGLNIEV
jgi:DNA-binding NarL/FixJ family response regulator